MPAGDREVHPRPALRWPNDSTSPASTANEAQRGRASPLILGSSSAPVTATSAGSVKRSSGPMYGLSSTAAPGRLPTSRFAATSENWSSAPEGGTPTW